MCAVTVVVKLCVCGGGTLGAVRVRDVYERLKSEQDLNSLPYDYFTTSIYSIKISITTEGARALRRPFRHEKFVRGESHESR